MSALGDKADIALMPHFCWRRGRCMASRRAAQERWVALREMLVTAGARRCLARRRALCTRPQAPPCEAAALAHSIAFRAMTPILATKSLPGAGQKPPKYPGPHTDQWDFWS